MSGIPLGKKEGPKLEFKSPDSLKKPDSIGREVVAMLNADGGEVWIGIEEKEGRASAVQPIQDPERAQRSLLDHLMDTIEPSPTEKEVEVSVVPDEEQRPLLCVRANPMPGRMPYAQIKGGGRYFLIRVADRLRPMSRDEIFASNKRKRSVDDEEAKASERIRAERQKLQEEGGSILWVRIIPMPPGEIDVQDKKLWDYFNDPLKTGNRRSGWNFANSQEMPKLKQGKIIFGSWRHTEIYRDASIAFTAPLECLVHGRKQEEIYPYALLEYPISLFRLASALYRNFSVEVTKIVADMALIGILDWVLRPYSPRSLDYLYPIPETKPYTEGKDHVDNPIVFDQQDIMKEPDRCGFRLVRRVYEAFGYDEDQIPLEFNRKAGVLMIPD